ncbi:MAG: ParB/RepB/Spo0J family partition protein [Microgenomates group bacterium]
MADKQVIQIEVDQLQPNPLQPRGLITPESLADLVESIREHGILEPLVVAKTPAGYQIIAGERRWRAAKILGLKTVPAIVEETTPRGMLEMALVENVQREDLNPIERAQAFLRLKEEFGLETKEIAKRIGKSPAYVSNSLALLKLPDALKDGLLSGQITEGHARALNMIADSRLMVEAYKIVIRQGLPVRATEDLARRMRKKIGQQPKALFPNASAPLIISDEIDRVRDDLHKAIGGNEKTIVKVSQSRIETRINIFLKGSPEEVEERLKKIYEGITGQSYPPVPTEKGASSETTLDQ